MTWALMLPGDWYSDTDPRGSRHSWSASAGMTASEKVNAILAWNQLLFELARAEIRRSHPDSSEQEVFLRAAARRLDRNTMLRVQGFDPELAGR